jgi:cytosine/adenosine deaminase-related metal-dependent hydrolase
MKTRIQGGYVVAYDGRGFELLDGGCVVYENDRILFVGFPDDPACPQAERVIQAAGKLVSPGLINLHCIANIDLQPLRIDGGATGFPKSKAWFESDEMIWDDDDYAVSAELSVAALLRHGSTTFCNVTTMASKRYNDPEVEPRLLAEASQRLGARAYLAHNFQDHSRYDEGGQTRVEYSAEAGRVGFERALRLVETLRSGGDDRIQPFLFPYTTETCSDELLQQASAAARDLGVPVRSHFAQYPKETVRDLEERGMS